MIKNTNVKLGYLGVIIMKKSDDKFNEIKLIIRLTHFFSNLFEKKNY